MNYGSNRSDGATPVNMSNKIVEKSMAKRDLAEYIRGRRIALGIQSREDFAIALGISQQAVDKLENGVSAPRLQTLAALARVLQVKENVLTDFLRDIKPNTEAVQSAYETVMTQDPYLLPEFADMIREILKLNAKYYAMRQSQETAQVAETKSEYYPTVIAAAGTAGDLALPENQRILQEIEAEEEAEAKDIAAEEAKRKKRPRPQPKPKE